MFCFGRKHGKAQYVNPDGNAYDCVYYHDMENRLDRSTSRCWDCSWLNIFFSLIVIGSLFPAIYVNQDVFWVTGVGYFCYLIESLCSQTHSFLINVLKANDLTVYLMTLG
jgi:hypothetical protein